jgi:hypothetical protein
MPREPPCGDEPVNTGRKPDGNFAPGNRVNPHGKPKGARDKATQMVDKLLYANVKGIAEVLVRFAVMFADPSSEPMRKI